MKLPNLLKQLESNLSNKGSSFTITSINHLEDIKRDLEKPYKQGLIEHTLFSERLSHFEFSTAQYKENLATIIITATPQPQQETIFRYKGNACHCLIPPTYSLQTDEQIEKIINDTIYPHGFTIVPATIPLKITAVRTRLARYGRNNITYSKELGSYFRLKAYLSDFPVIEDNWYEFELMPQCKSCNACIQSCPTGAIRSEQILIQSDRCLTYHNERAGDFPTWIEKSWHNCLIGCMKCQSVCPINKNIDVQPKKSVEFSEDETTKFINATYETDIPDSVVIKLKELSLFEDWPLLVRNLKVMLAY